MVQSPSGSNKNINYNASPSSVTSQLQTAGTEFLLVIKNRQSSEPQVFSSGDPQQTQAMFQQARSTIDTRETTA